jgi:hypothetical protein
MQTKHEKKSLYAATLRAFEDIRVQLRVMKRSSKFDAVVAVKTRIEIQESESSRY